LESGFWTGQKGCAPITELPFRNEGTGAVCHMMKGIVDVAELKQLLLEGGQEDARRGLFSGLK
jgi:hypothetical protein